MFSERRRAEAEQLGGRAHVRGDVVYWLGRYGLYEAYRENSGISYDDVSPTIVAMHQIWHDDPETFVRKLADIVLPVGGWPVYGAHKMVGEILGDYSDERYVEVFKAAMRFARARKVPLTLGEVNKLSRLGEL